MDNTGQDIMQQYNETLKPVSTEERSINLSAWELFGLVLLYN